MQNAGRRRSARLAFDEDSSAKERGEDLPAAKRSRKDDGRAASGKSAPATQSGRAASRKKTASYEEEADDGFKFTRTRSKKVQPPPPIPESPQSEKRAPPARRKKSLSTSGGQHDAREKEVTRPRRKSPRFSGGSAHEDERIKQPEKKVRTPSNAQQRSPQVSDQASGDSENKESKQIALPFSDTPVISRNKEFRKNPGSGHRRSSIGLRGRRASSLIDSGSNAVPHREVKVSDFYKHISGEGLSEPRRMKQLLIWCGTRAMGEKPSYSSKDSHARLAARVIQEELLKDFSNRSELSDWFSREESTPAAIVKKPNPRNISNAAKVGELEAQIKKLEEEREAWESLKKPLTKTSTSKLPTDIVPSPGTIDSSLLDPEQAGILSSLSTNKDIVASTGSDLKEIASTLEFKVDQFAEGVHRLGQYQETADRVASRVLALAATRLDRREREKLARAGTAEMPIQEVLRSIATLER
ncbi:MAG: hypothetical protein M4579_006098 [Chaenotheca gracillima]|nr:MAG: hypothetical protein M4579_006098 [Chaenotheca gracillima]